MQTTSPSVAVEEIREGECRDLLEGKRLGRLGVVVAGRPEIFPVNYSLDVTGAVVFETAPGTKLAAAVNHHVVFEVDHTETNRPDSGSGWSVVVHGVAHQTHPDKLRFAGRRHHSWLPEMPFTVRIHSNQVTGRRLTGPRLTGPRLTSPRLTAGD